MNAVEPQITQMDADEKVEGYFESIIESRNHLRTSAPSAGNLLQAGGKE